MINSKKIARKNAKKIKYGIFSFLVLGFGSLATASVFLIPKKKIKKNDVHSTKSKIDFSAKSIARYGNLTSEAIKVDYDGTNYTFQINDKTTITGLAKLNTELNIQGDTEDDYTIDDLGSLTIDQTKTAAKAKAKAESINDYGNLTSETIEVDYGTDYTFQINDKTTITGLVKLNTELNIQGDTTSTDYTIDNLPLKFDTTKTISRAKSIEIYGNLTDLNNTISVSNDDDGEIKHTVNEQELNFADLKAEAIKQEITSLTNENELTNNLVLGNLVTTELTKAKSIKRYGNLISQTINVSNDTNGTIKYVVKSNQKLNFDQLQTKIELGNQEITLTEGKNTETTLDATQLTDLDVGQLATARTKKTSIETHGNLRTQAISVSNDNDGVIKYTAKSNQKISFDQLKAEATKQEITLANGKNTEATLDRTDFKGLDETQLATAKKKKKSITTYGDLTTQVISVSNDTNGAIEYTVNSEKLNFTDLKAEAIKQGITLTEGKNTEATLDAAHLKKLNVTQLANANTKKTSIKTYGDLTSQLITVSYNGAIKYTVKNNQVIEFDQLKTEALKQGIILTTEEALTTTQLTSLDATQLTKANSIKTFGNLTSETIEVDYGTDYTFQIVGKTKITGLEDLNTELNNQGDTENDYTIDNLPSSLSFDGTKTKARAKSIATYGNLTSEAIKVDYKTDYTFQVGTNSLITGLTNLNIQLNNQGDTTTDYTIDTLPSTLTIDTTKTIAKAKITKYNFKKAQNYFDVKDASFFNKANDETINLITTEINKINDYDTLVQEVKDIVDHSNNSDLKNSLNIKLKKLKTKKANLESAKIYLDLNIKDPSMFNNATKKGINLIIKEIDKDNLTILPQEVQEIINHNDNSNQKIVLTKKIKALKIKKNFLKKARKYFNLKIKDPSSFTKASKKEIELITSEIKKKDVLKNFSSEVQWIINVNNLILKRNLDRKFTLLKIKKTNLESAKTYFDLSDVKNASFFNKANDETIETIAKEIYKINDYFRLLPEVKEIINHHDNLIKKNALETTLKSLQTKKTNLELARTYLDLYIKNPLEFIEPTEETISLIDKEIKKDNFNILSKEVQEIINHRDNLIKKNTITDKFNSLKKKKSSLEKIKAKLKKASIARYGDLKTKLFTSFENQKFKFNTIKKSDAKLSISELNTQYFLQYDFDLELKSLKNVKKEEKKWKNLILDKDSLLKAEAKAYFDLSDVKNASIFIKTNQKTINAITTEINKINNYDHLSNNVKKIVNHNDNSGLKNALNTRLQELQTKKTNLIKVQNYSDLSNIKKSSFFNRADKTTIEAIKTEINKISDQNDFSYEVFEIFNHPDNFHLKLALFIRLQELKTKKTNLESAKTFFDLNIKDPSLFNNSIEKDIELISEEINKINNYDHLSDDVKTIIDHNDNVDLKKKWSISLENFKLQLHNQRILNFFKKQNVLMDFRKKDYEFLQIFLYPYKVLNEDIEATIETQNNQKLKHLPQKKFLEQKKQKKSLKQISIIENGNLLKNSLFVDYLNHQFVFKDCFNIDHDFVIFGIKSLIKELMLQSIVDISFFPWNIEQFEKKLINVSDKKIFFKNWKQAKQKWSLDQAKKNFLQSNNHLLNLHSQNNLFMHPSFILTFFMIIFCVDCFVKWIKKLWKN